MCLAPARIVVRQTHADQCVSCGRLLDPPDLVQPHSAISGDTSLELRWSRPLFLRQSQLVERLRTWLETRDFTGGTPQKNAYMLLYVRTSDPKQRLPPLRVRSTA
jgi:methionyl-tRNA synthetase